MSEAAGSPRFGAVLFGLPCGSTNLEVNLLSTWPVFNPALVEQTVRDLVVRACASPRRGKVEVSTRDLWPADEPFLPPGRWVELTIKDPNEVDPAETQERARLAMGLLAPTRAERRGWVELSATGGMSIRIVLPCPDRGVRAARGTSPSASSAKQTA